MDFALASALKRKAKEKEKEKEKKEKQMADQATEHPVVESSSTTPAGPPVVMGYEQMAAMLKMVLETNAAQTRQLVTEAIAEMKKPTPEEQEKLNKEKEKELRMVKARIEVGKAEQERRTARQRNCAHKRPDGSWAASGQEFSDGSAKIICLQCQKFLYDGPTNPMFKQGVGVNIQLHNVQ